MLYQRLHSTGALLRRICAMVAILSVSVAGVAVARSFEGAVSHSDGVRVSVDRVEIDDHTVTLGLQAENQSSQTINLNNLNVGNGLSLSDDRGGRYLFLPPPTNRTLMVEPNQVMSGDLVFFGPVRQDISTLTLTTGVPGAFGKPLELTMNTAAGTGPGIVAQSMGTDGPLAFKLDPGAPAGVVSEGVTALAKTIDSAGVRCNAVGDIKTREWSKFVAWAGLVPLAALTRLNTWRYLQDENGAWIAVKLVREVAQLAKALQIPLMDLSPLPAQTLVQSSDRDAIAAVQEIGRRFQTNAPEHRMSTLQDIDRGTALEIEETLGFAVRRAKELGLQMPTLELSYGFLKIGR